MQRSKKLHSLRKCNHFCIHISDFRKCEGFWKDLHSRRWCGMSNQSLLSKVRNSYHFIVHQLNYYIAISWNTKWIVTLTAPTYVCTLIWFLARVLVTPFILEWNPTPTPLEKKEWNPLLHSILISKGVNPPLHSPLQQKYKFLEKIKTKNGLFMLVHSFLP